MRATPQEWRGRAMSQARAGRSVSHDASYEARMLRRYIPRLEHYKLRCQGRRQRLTLVPTKPEYKRNDVLTGWRGGYVARAFDHNLDQHSRVFGRKNALNALIEDDGDTDVAAILDTKALRIWTGYQHGGPSL